MTAFIGILQFLDPGWAIAQGGRFSPDERGCRGRWGRPYTVRGGLESFGDR